MLNQREPVVMEISKSLLLIFALTKIGANCLHSTFDLSQPMFGKIAKYEGGIVPVMYRKVQCAKTGGIKFEIKGNKNWMVVLVYNVGGVGDVKDVKVKGSNAKWIQMSRDWGQNWETGTQLVGQSLSFQVTTSNGIMLRSDNVVPDNWKFGNAYEGKQF
ncbi:hypothetical protein LguiA_032584 [Lonicera macranthoides]